MNPISRINILARVGAFVFVVFVFSLAPSARADADVLNLLSTFVVDRLTDANPTGGGEGSGLAGDLRYAITNAQSGDSITYNVTGTINLSGALPNLTRNVNIQGPGASSLIVNGGGGRVFTVANGTTVILSGLTITGGVGNGGGIFNRGALTLNGVNVSGNVAGDPTNGGGTGPGIWNYIDATLILNNCTVSGNSAIGNLSYNPSRGGGIANYGTLTLKNATVSGNSASQGFGGGVNNTGTISLTNSTVSGNSATFGGGIHTSGGTATLTNVTFSGNSAADGGGVFNGDVPATVTHLKNTLIAGSLSGGNCQGKAFASSQSSLSSDGTCALGGVGDQNEVDPLLTALGNYGGPTLVHMLEVGSPAIDAVVGSDAPATDQRGFPRPQGGGYDIGAVERQSGDFVFPPTKLYFPLILNKGLETVATSRDSSIIVREIESREVR